MGKKKAEGENRVRGMVQDLWGSPPPPGARRRRSKYTCGGSAVHGGMCHRKILRKIDRSRTQEMLELLDNITEEDLERARAEMENETD